MASRTREELERAIDDEPYDAEGYAVLGDLLQREGDPRGELVALQLAAERDPAHERCGVVSQTSRRHVQSPVWHHG